METGQEISDLTASLEGKYNGEGIAVSPDGSKVALVSRMNDGAGVEVLEVRSGTVLSSLRLGNNLEIKYRIAFAGNLALMIAEEDCEDRGCDKRSSPRGRVLRVWDFAGAGPVKTLTWPGRETYRSFGASSDGKLLFAYSGSESFCESCNDHFGELKVEDARFTVWHRPDWEVVARSPRLTVIEHACGFSLGACSDWEDVPGMQMSENGNAILAFWRFGIDPSAPPPNEPEELKVFLLH